MKLKVCGMKHSENIIEVSKLKPDYMGFIFYDKSPRNFKGEISELPAAIKKVGVFVNSSIANVIEKVNEYNLQAVQLHGEETPEFCRSVKFHPRLKQRAILESQLIVIKVFSIKNNFNFELLKPYEEICDYFLFDTKGKNPGGNGYTFDWNVLKNYPSTKPYFLSGGIGLEEIEKLELFFKSDASTFCKAIDVNSKFEVKAGLKDIEILKKFKKSAPFFK